MAANVDPKSLEKLKELESNIAKELDQKVTLSQPSDVRLEGSVQLNPSLDLSPPPEPTPAPTKIEVPPPVIKQSAGPINSHRNVEDITLEEVDALLKDADSGFATRMEEIKKEVSQVQVSSPLESISIGADYLKGENKADTSTDLVDEILMSEDEPQVTVSTESLTFWGAFKELTTELAALPIDLVKAFFQQILLLRSLPPRQVLTDTIGLAKSLIASRFAAIGDFIGHLKSYSRRQYIKFAVFSVLFLSFLFTVRDIVKHSKRAGEVDPFLKSFDEVADSKIKLGASGTEKEKASPIPEFIVALPKIVANLKPDKPRKQPMVTVELFFEASDRETAVEIQKRSTELRDSAARVLEQSTFQQLDNPEGKEKLKQRMKMALNRILNSGRIQSVFFKSIQIRE